MKVIHLTPGTGNFHCGSCLRDNHLVKALRKAGHEAVMVPLYLPLVTDDEPASGDLPVLAGGINLFLRDRWPWWRSMPDWITRWLDRPSVLKLAAGFTGMTSARQLGEMTLESLRGTGGRQRDDWKRLVDWIAQAGKPDLVSLSNGLLNGLAPAIRNELNVPVVCSLQGEDSFLDTLPEPWRGECWEVFRENSRHVNRYVATSEWYASTMRRRMELADDHIVTVHNGLDLTGFAPPPQPPASPVIGYLARLCAGKGLHRLVDAWLILAREFPDLRLAIGGTATRADDAFIGQQKAKIAAAGLTARVEWRVNLSYVDKIRHLQSLTVLSVPASYGEAFGLYILEALACGVPVVEPDHAGPGELVRATGGGLLCAPDDAASLADALRKILRDGGLRRSLGEAGRKAVLERFTAERMASGFAAVCGAVTGGCAVSPAAGSGTVPV